MDCRRYYTISFFVALFSILTPASLWASQSPFIENAGTVEISGSNSRATIRGITGANPSLGTVDSVIDARDRFGNPVRRLKTLRINPSRLKSFFAFCRSPSSCAGAIAIQAALVSLDLYLDEEVVNGQAVTTVSKMVTPGECVFAQTTSADNPAITRNVMQSVPCTQANSGFISVWSPSSVESYETAGIHADPQPVYVGNPHAQQQLWRYNLQLVNGEPEVQIQQVAQPVSDAQLATLAAQNPELMRVTQTEYAPVFDPITLSEDDVLQPEEGLNPYYPWEDLGEGSDGSSGGGNEEPQEPMIGLDLIPHESVDVEEFFVFGSKWLPGQCPAPLQVDILSYHQELPFEQACSILQTYVAPFFRIAGMAMFCMILFRGVA